jgi:hypothetical protein
MQSFLTDPAYTYDISFIDNTNNGTKTFLYPTSGTLSTAEKVVRVMRLAQNVTVDVRYTLYTRPYSALLDSSKYFMVEARNLLSAGFLPGTHFVVMTKDEAYKFDGQVCVTYATEPHFLVSQQDNPNNSVSLPNNFVSAVRKFIESGGNFLAQCGGLSTYEQCDNVLPSVLAIRLSLLLAHSLL